jgi:hypothetical protein
VSSNLFVEEVMTLNSVRCAPAVILCAVILSAAPAFARQESTPVTAVVLPDGRYSNVAIREMGREAAHILKHSGIALRWRIGVPAQAVNGMLIVVKLQGRCDMDGSPAFLEPGALGWAHAVNGTMLPFSDLACENLRGVVEAAIADGNPARANVLLGRAMGRVLAHELYHIVADTSEHGRDGVTQATLTPRELTSGSLELRDSELRAVENALVRGR